MAPPRSAWAPDRALTNAKFEGYKLSFHDDDDEPQGDVDTAGTSLDRRIMHLRFDPQSPLPGRILRGGGADIRLGYKQARNRARWNHLSPGQGQEAAWMDSEGGFWMIDLEVRVLC
jgi:hypothetical protein